MNVNVFLILFIYADGILGYKNPHDAILRHCKNKGGRVSRGGNKHCLWSISRKVREQSFKTEYGGYICIYKYLIRE